MSTIYNTNTGYGKRGAYSYESMGLPEQALIATVTGTTTRASDTVPADSQR